MSNHAPYVINSDQVRAAWKMLQTLADEYALSGPEQSFLLHAVTVVALRNSIDRSEIEWVGTDCPLHMFIAGGRVEVREASLHPLVLHARVTEEEADTAYGLVERLLDRHEMPEQERAGLYSALPCLGFHALQRRCLRWKMPPPFKTLLPKPSTRRKRR